MFEIDNNIIVISDHSVEQFDFKFASDPYHKNTINYISVNEAKENQLIFSASDLIIVDIMACGGDVMTILDRINDLCLATAQRAIVIFTADCIDQVTGAISAPSVILLCNPSAIERLATVTLAARMLTSAVRETRDRVPDGLQTLADEVARIARALADMAGHPATAGGDVFSDGLIGYRAASPAKIASGSPVRAADVRAMIQARRLRDRYLPPEIFGEPAWDMLLDLFAARIERASVAVSSLCIAAAVPPTTALRTIGTMTTLGLVTRVADPADRRRVFIALTDATAEAMRAYVCAAHDNVA
jgi:hypothetical protein